jgi:hypothetical protein
LTKATTSSIAESEFTSAGMLRFRENAVDDYGFYLQLFTLEMKKTRNNDKLPFLAGRFVKYSDEPSKQLCGWIQFQRKDKYWCCKDCIEAGSS